MIESHRLDRFDNSGFSRGRPRVIELAWIVSSALFVSSWIPGSAHRRMLLRFFGASIGAGVVIKPGVRVKFPWRLSVGDHSWIGESTWIDNLADVKIGSHCCLSQGCYVCTGSHDWSSKTFNLITKPITIEDSVWICAMARIAPGVTVHERAVVGFGMVVRREVEAGAVVRQ
jgi:putative colanic acid biosynthesis acetyltransferase WcaF